MLFTSLARRVCAYFGVNLAAPNAAEITGSAPGPDLLSRSSLPNGSEFDPASRDRHKRATLSVRSFLGGAFIGINLSDRDHFFYLDLHDRERPWRLPPVIGAESREGRIADLLSQIVPEQAPLRGLFESNTRGGGVQLIHLPHEYREASATFVQFSDALKVGAGINLMHANHFKLYSEAATEAGRFTIFFKGVAADTEHGEQRPAWFFNFTDENFVYHRRTGSSSDDNHVAKPIFDPALMKSTGGDDYRRQLIRHLATFFESGRQNDRLSTIQGTRGIIILALPADQQKQEIILKAFWKILEERDFDRAGVPFLAFYRIGIGR